MSKSSNTKRHSLREKCPNKEFFLVCVFLYSHFPSFGLNTERYLIRTEYGEIRSISPFSVQMRENANTGKYRSEKTPHLDTFHAVTISKNKTKNERYIIQVFQNPKLRNSFSELALHSMVPQNKLIPLDISIMCPWKKNLIEKKLKK